MYAFRDVKNENNKSEKSATESRKEMSRTHGGVRWEENSRGPWILTEYIGDTRSP